MVRDGAEPVIGPRFARTRWRLLTMRGAGFGAFDLYFVMAGLDRAIYLSKMMDTRVKPAYDNAGDPAARRFG